MSDLATLNGTIPTVEEAWRDRLFKQLCGRTRELQWRQDYYDGEQALPTAPDKADEKYRRLAQMGQANVTSLVVDAKTERMTVAGVRTSNDPAGDVDLWRDYWQANDLDDESLALHDKVLTVGRAFVLVWPNMDGGVPSVEITPEDPCEMIVAYAPGSRRERTAALKVFVDPDEKKMYATLWLPDGVWFWQAKWKQYIEGRNADWKPWAGPDDAGYRADNPFAPQIPVVEFRCRPTLTGRPNPEVTNSVIRIQDRINKTIFDRLVLSEFQAYPQRWAIGIQDELDPVSGRPLNPLKPGPQRVWTFPADEETGASVTLGQFDAADMSPHLKAVESDIQTLAAITKVPVYYLMGQMVNISADAIRAAEAGLVAVVKKHQRAIEGCWEEVLRLAMTVAGDVRGADVALELVWKDPENRSLAEAVDAALKNQSIGIPFEQLLEDIGYSPQKIAIMSAMRQADALLAPSPTPVAPAMSPGVGGVQPGP